MYDLLNRTNRLRFVSRDGVPILQQGFTKKNDPNGIIWYDVPLWEQSGAPHVTTTTSDTD